MDTGFRRYDGSHVNCPDRLAHFFEPKRRVSIKKIPNFVLFVSFVVKYPTLYFAG